MYSKRVLILSQTNKRFAQKNKDLCGMVKLVNGVSQTEVSMFVTNAETAIFGEWWLLLACGKNLFAKKVENLHSFSASLPLQNLASVGCLLVKKEDKCYEVARAKVGSDASCDVLAIKMPSLVGEEQTSPYESFVASCQNFYNGVDVDSLKKVSKDKYKCVTDYSDAFERFYASGQNTNYYDSVKAEIAKVFLQFPPYYPLTQRYKHSFFVRIDFPTSEKFFVLGILQKDGVVRYICYGLPAEKATVGDKDFVLVENSPTNFWMLFQDASTGQITTIDTTV